MTDGGRNTRNSRQGACFGRASRTRPVRHAEHPPEARRPRGRRRTPGAELVVFPEAFVGGYPKGHDFGVSVGMRTSEGRDEFRRLSESAVEVRGPATEFIGSAAKDHGLHLVVGVTERDGGTLYCTALSSSFEDFSAKSRKSFCHKNLQKC